jgi:3',5'-cyclic AMP phosphodiesterase CpdA
MRFSRLLSISFVAALASGCPGGARPTAGPAEVLAPTSPREAPIPLPNAKGSLKFVVFGDFGEASQRQYDLAKELATFHGSYPFDMVVLVGDNLYGSERPQDFKLKFEDPYKPLLDAGVKFYAALGNHDAREQRYYKLFNMDGKLYYSLKAPNESVRFFMLDSTYPVPEQIEWLEKELKGSNEDWKIAVFHHPLYSSGDRHGSDIRLRDALEPLFVKHNVSVVLTGHDHFYERVKAQKGITYFVVGSGGQLRKGNIDRTSGLTASGFDTDLAFMAVEIAGDEMFFNAISRQGAVVDSGVLTRRKAAEAGR